MCLISISGKGTDKYGKLFIDGIEQGARNNDDGHGFAWKRNGENTINFEKGIFNIDELIRKLVALNLEMEDELIVHSRIGNVGKTTAENTHPFIISDCTEDLTVLSGNTDLPVVMHNGTFYDFRNNCGDFSDTHMFIKEILGTPEIITLLERDPQKALQILKSHIGTNKLAFVFPNSDCCYFGDFIKDSGYFFSNESYKKDKVRNVGGVDSYPGKEYTWDDWKDEDEYDEFSGKERTSSLANQANLFSGKFNPGEKYKAWKKMNKKDKLEEGFSLVKDNGYNVTIPIFSNTILNITPEIYGHFYYWLPKEAAMNFMDKNRFVTIVESMTDGILQYKYTDTGSALYNLNNIASKAVFFEHVCFEPRDEYTRLYASYYELLEVLSETPSKSQMKKFIYCVKTKMNKNDTRNISYRNVDYPVYCALLYISTFFPDKLKELTPQFIAFGSIPPVRESNKNINMGDIIYNGIEIIEEEEEVDEYILSQGAIED